MEPNAVTECRRACSTRTTRQRWRATSSRAAALALAAAALALMMYGESWLLDRPAPLTNPLSIATCAVDVLDMLSGEQHATETCANGRLAHAGGMPL